MKTNQACATDFPGAGIAAVSRGMIRERATELAAMHGRQSSEVCKSDWEEAKRELAGIRELESQAMVSQFLPAPERGDTTDAIEEQANLLADD